MLNISIGNEPISREEIQDQILNYLLHSPNAGKGIIGISNVLAEIILMSRSQVRQVEDEINVLRLEVERLSKDARITEALQFLRHELDFSIPAEDTNRSSYSTIASELWDAADGFYHLEWSDDGRPFRWAGPKNEFEFRVYIKRKCPLKMTLNALSIHPDLDFTTLRCFVDDAEVPLHLDFLKSNIAYTSVLSVRSAIGPTNIRFQVPRVGAAAPPDERRLSLAILGLDVEAVDQNDHEPASE